MKKGKINRNFTKRTDILKQLLLTKIQKLEQKLKNKNELFKDSQSIKKEAKITLSYAQSRITQRVNDKPRIDLFYDIIDNKYSDICFDLCAKEALISSDTISTFSNVFPLIKTYPDLVIDIATIFPNPPDIICNYLDSCNLWEPEINLVTDAFTFDPVTSQVMDAKYRYLINMDGNLIRDYLDDRNNTNLNIKVNCELFLQLSNQSRWNNLWVQIAATFFYMDTISQSKALQNLKLDFLTDRRYATSLITLQTIAYIIRKFTMLPFSIRQDGRLDISDFKQKWTTCLIPLLYSLLELSKEEKGCNINEEFLIPVICYRVKCAYTSFETETLDRKSLYSSMIKLITSKLTKYARYHYDKS